MYPSLFSQFNTHKNMRRPLHNKGVADVKKVEAPTHLISYNCFMAGQPKTDLNTNERKTSLITSRREIRDSVADGVTLHLLMVSCDITRKSWKLSNVGPMVILTSSDRLLHINGMHLSLNLTEDDILSLLLNPIYLKAPGKPMIIPSSRCCEERFFPLQDKSTVKSFRSLFLRIAPESSTVSEMLEREMALLGLLIKMKNLPSLKETSLRTSSDNNKGVWSIEDLEDHIRNHFDAPLNLEEMAARCALNASYLSRSFKNKTGTTIFAYLNQIRIEKACLLLKSSDMTITEIAFSVGYNNISFFNRMFKRAMSETPGEYRKRIRS